MFTLCGAWHGTGWMFPLWGLWHGVFVALERFGRGGMDRLERSVPGRIVLHVYTLLVVVLPWADRKICGRLGLNLRGGVSANPRADRLLKVRQGLLTSGLAVYLFIYFFCFMFQSPFSQYIVFLIHCMDGP